MTLVEVMVAFGLGSLVLAFAVSFYVISANNFASFDTYSDLNQQDRFASDMLTRDIRSASTIVSFSSTQLNLNNSAGAPVIYSYSSVANTMSRSNNGIVQVLLRDIVAGSFAFSVYERPTNSSMAFEQFPVATNTSVAKLVSFTWNCSALVKPSTLPHSEAMNSGLVSIRNQ